jgi:hypothetical protein
MPWVRLDEAAAQVVEGVRERLENQTPKRPGGCESRAAGKFREETRDREASGLAEGNAQNPGKLGRAGARIW